MSAVTSIARDRVEIGRVTGNGAREWLMLVIEDDASEPIDAVFYPSRDEAVAAAETWNLPVRFVHGIGTVKTAEAL